MKQILFALIAILGTTSCSITNKIPPSIKTVVVDYSSYANSGFFITESNSVDFKYTPVGSVITEIRDGYEVKQGYGGVDIAATTSMSIYDALDELAYKCVGLGANGIINVNITSKTVIEGKGMVYVITGMAIYSDELPQPVYEAAPVNESREEYNQPAVMEREEVKQSARTRRY